MWIHAFGQILKSVNHALPLSLNPNRSQRIACVQQGACLPSKTKLKNAAIAARSAALPKMPQ